MFVEMTVTTTIKIDIDTLEKTIDVVIDADSASVLGERAIYAAVRGGLKSALAAIPE